MRIGILTFHGADNFGCVLQCMALQNAVKILLPQAEVEVINYVMPNLAEKKLFIPYAQLKQIRKEKGKKIAYKRLKENLKTLCGRKKRIYKFQQFRNKNLNISGAPFSTASEVKNYDVCIVGSDQVWNIGLVKNKEDVFFLKMFNSNVRKISYAASTGHSQFSAGELKWMQENLADMDAVSIREKSAYSCIQPIVKNKVHVCLDPTLLHKAEYWRTIEKRPKGIGNGKYVFMYGLGYAFCKEQERKACELAREIAEKENVIVIHSYYGEYRKRFDKSAKHCYYQGPEEFLWLVDHAEYVVNCSYHGTVFSIIFQKPFYTFSTGGNSARMEDLVDTLGINDRYLEDKIGSNKISWNIDWKEVNTRWEAERNKSLTYLKNAIEGKEFEMVEM